MSRPRNDIEFWFLVKTEIRKDDFNQVSGFPVYTVDAQLDGKDVTIAVGDAASMNQIGEAVGKFVRNTLMLADMRASHGAINSLPGEGKS